MSVHLQNRASAAAPSVGAQVSDSKFRVEDGMVSDQTSFLRFEALGFCICLRKLHLWQK